MDLGVVLEEEGGIEHKNASQRSTSLVCQILENISRGDESGSRAGTASEVGGKLTVCFGKVSRGDKNLWEKILLRDFSSKDHDEKAIN